MNRLVLAPFAVALAVACGGDSAVRVSGSWDFAATFTAQAIGISCATTGNLLLAHSEGGTRVTGLRSNTEVECEGGTPELEDALSQSATVINANVRGNVITMEIAFCEFEGTVTMGTPAGDVMSGTLECRDGLPTQAGVFTGPWEASR